MYADDTVIYNLAKDPNELQQKLSDDFNRVALWLESNDLIMNMKTGKTECMIFGTSKKSKTKILISLIIIKAFQKHQTINTLV